MKKRLSLFLLLLTSACIYAQDHLTIHKRSRRSHIETALIQIADHAKHQVGVQLPRKVKWNLNCNVLTNMLYTYRVQPQTNYARLLSKLELDKNTWGVDPLMLISNALATEKPFQLHSADKAMFISIDPASGSLFYFNKHAVINPTDKEKVLPDTFVLIKKTEETVDNTFLGSYVPARKSSGELMLQCSETTYQKANETKQRISLRICVPRSYDGALPFRTLGGNIWLEYGSSGMITEASAIIRHISVLRRIDPPSRRLIEEKIKAGRVSNAETITGYQDLEIKQLEVFYDEKDMGVNQTEISPVLLVAADSNEEKDLVVEIPLP